MSRWTYLAAAIASEVTATLAMRAALDHPAWFALVTVGYVIAFILIGKVLELGVPLGVAYGIWGASGVAATAALAVPLYGDPFTATMALGIAVLIAGVLLVEIGHHRATAHTDPTELARAAAPSSPTDHHGLEASR